MDHRAVIGGLYCEVRIRVVLRLWGTVPFFSVPRGPSGAMFGNQENIRLGM